MPRSIFSSSFGDRHEFFEAWIEQLDKPKSLILDTTSHSTEAQQIVDAEWGYNRDCKRLPQVYLSLVMEREHRLPLYYRTLSGLDTRRCFSRKDGAYPTRTRAQ